MQSSQELFETYISQRLSDPQSQGVYPPSKAPSPAQTQRYVSWLAQKLEAIGETEFLIEEMQPGWLRSTKERWLYGAIVRLSFGLIYGLIFGLMGRLSRGLSDGLSFGLSFGLIGGLISGLIVEINDIAPIEQLSWSWRKAKDGLSFVLIYGLSFGLIGGLIRGLSHGLISGLSFVLILGLSCGLIGGLIVGLSDFAVEDKTVPNQGIWKSVVNAGISGLVFGLVFGLSVGLSVGLVFGLVFGLSVGLVFGLIYGLGVGLSVGLIFGLLKGGLAVIQHFALRLVLCYNGSTPWNSAKFLDHAVKHRFIQRVGGRYRFMHDPLRKHFAQMPLN